MPIKRTKIATPIGITQALAQNARQRRQTLRELHESASHMSARRNDLRPDLKLVLLPTGSLKPADRRVRRADPAQIERVIASISKFGLCAPLLISGDHQLVHGHTVWEAARQLGIHEVYCVVVDHLGPADLRTLSIALNRLGERGSWDFEALQLEFEELGTPIEGLVATGFEMAEIDMILTEPLSETPEEEADAIPNVGTDAVSRPGDVWHLGTHKLIQGDARDPECYSRLLTGDAAARLVLTDVPYNVSVRKITGDDRHREFAMAFGEMTREEFLNFNVAWMKPAAHCLVSGGVLSTAIDWENIDVLMAAAREHGLAHINTAVWAKTNAGQGSTWRSGYELYPVFRKGASAHVNNVELGRLGRWRSNVWIYPGASSFGSDSREGLKLHPTVKPRALIEDVFLDITNRGDIVVDCFAGSGSAVVAAEATGRRCMAIEIDGLYCDVIIRRYQEMTGEEAVLEGSGATFASTAVSRLGGDKFAADEEGRE